MGRVHRLSSRAESFPAGGRTVHLYGDEEIPLAPSAAWGVVDHNREEVQVLDVAEVVVSALNPDAKPSPLRLPHSDKAHA